MMRGMLKRIQNILMHSEWKLSLWQIVFGGSGVMGSFSLSAWAASATVWINQFGPIAWVGAGFTGALLFLLALLIFAVTKHHFQFQN